MHSHAADRSSVSGTRVALAMSGTPGLRAPAQRFTLRDGAESWSHADQAADEANPVAVRAVMAGGNRDAVDLGVAWLQLQTHPLVKRDRAAVARGGDRADQGGAASPGSLEERLLQQAAEPVAPSGRIHPGKVNAGLAGPGLRDESGQEPGEPAVAFGGEAGVSEVPEK
jgi:hypothetical protein